MGSASITPSPRPPREIGLTAKEWPDLDLSIEFCAQNSRHICHKLGAVRCTIDGKMQSPKLN